MRTFDFTNGKQFPETLHVRKGVPYPLSWSFYRRDTADMWIRPLRYFIESFQNQQVGNIQFSVLRDFAEFVHGRVPIYFVNKSQIGTAIEVQETAYSMYDTFVPDNHIIVPQISKNELGRSYNNWEECFQPYIARDAEERRPHRDHYPFDQEIFPDLCESDATMIEIEAEALYCPTGGDPECEVPNPEIFVYMDYFVDAQGTPTRPRNYMAYVIAHELAHAMMDERLWEAFLCKKGQTLSKGISHSSKRYYLLEEGLATAAGWYSVERDKQVAQEIMRVGLPYSFGLSPYYHTEIIEETKTLGGVVCRRRRSWLLFEQRIPEWLSAKLNDPTPYL